MNLKFGDGFGSPLKSAIKSKAPRWNPVPTLPVAALLAFGILLWAFLLTPYGVDAHQCITPPEKRPATRPALTEQSRIKCLKPVAQRLREDSIIAMYATASFAGVIAYFLRPRNGINRNNGNNAPPGQTADNPDDSQDETGPGQT